MLSPHSCPHTIINSLTSSSLILQQKLSDTNTLFEIDQVTQDIIKALLDADKVCMIGDKVDVPHTDAKISFFPNKQTSKNALILNCSIILVLSSFSFFFFLPFKIS